MDGVTGLQSLVESAATGGVQIATAATAVEGEVICLLHLDRVLVDVDNSPLTRINTGKVTEGDHVDPSMGGREHS